MSISTAASGSPINKPVGTFAFVDVTTGNLSAAGLQLLNQWYNFIVGMNRITPCNASTTLNVIKLTPLSASPLITGYVDYEIYSFVADVTSTGNLTATVVPATGALATIKVFKTNGSAQATTNDVTINLQYELTYVDSLDSGNGGFVLR